MATRCCWPPDSARNDRSRSSCRPRRSIASSTRRRIASDAHPEVLHGVGQLVLDGLGHEAGQRVLAHEADDVGQIARPVVPGRPPVHGDRPRQRPAAEVRDQTVDRPQQG